MSTGKHAFKETDVARLMRAAERAKVSAYTLRIKPGAIELEIKGAPDIPDSGVADDEWKVA